jgi:hypothetical protein
MLEPEHPQDDSCILGDAIPRRKRMTPSTAMRNDHAAPHSSNGMTWGRDIHALLEKVAWADESPPVLPASEAGNVVAMLLRNPALHEVFERRGRPIELFREQAADAIIGDHVLTGVIDRLLLHRNPAGTVTRVEIIDFKTDAVQDPAELRERHAGQMTAYRCALEKIYPQAEVRAAINGPVRREEHEKLFKGVFAYAKQAFEEMASQEREPTGQDRLLWALCRPERLIELARQFILYDETLHATLLYRRLASEAA